MQGRSPETRLVYAQQHCGNVPSVTYCMQIFRTAEATSSMDESTAATPATPPEASADVAKDAPEVDQKINAVSAVAEVAAADNGSAFQEAALAADIGDSGDKLEEGDEWSEATVRFELLLPAEMAENRCCAPVIQYSVHNVHCVVFTATFSHVH